MTVHSFDEWSQLEEVIVGRAENYIAHHYDTTFRLLHGVFPMDEKKSKSLFFEAAPFIDRSGYVHENYIKIPTKIQDELIEDVEGLADTLKLLGVKVRRPEKLNRVEKIVSPYWETYPIPALNIRDQVIFLGDTIVETSPYVRARMYENDLLKPLMHEYFDEGSGWLCMPRATLAKNSFDNSYLLARGQNVDEYIQADSAKEAQNMPFEFVFDGAQCMRFGEDVIVNISNHHHELASTWLQRTFGSDFNFHVIRGAANHLDSIMLPLRPGTMLLRSPEFVQHLPPALQKWDFIVPPDADKAYFPTYDDPQFYIASKYIDLNVLSVNENTVVVNELCPPLIKLLEKNGFDVVPVRHRHRRLFSGGFHCFTLDSVRRGGKERYF